MIGIVPFSLLQAAADVGDRLTWIAWAQTVMAFGTVLLAIMGIGLAIAGWYALRAANRVLASVERTIERLAPRTEPLLDRAGRVADDAAEVSQRVRQTIEQVNGSVEDLHNQLRGAASAAEARIRRFGAVLDAAQSEVEAVLLDVAATARGFQIAAEALRGSRGAHDELNEAADDD